MRFIFLAIVFVLLAVGVGHFIREDPGYVFFGYGAWSVESTLAVFLVALVVVFVLLYFSVRALASLWKVPGKLGVVSRERAKQRARRGLNDGLIELSEGRWERAERLLLRDAQRSEHALLHYLGAARAAQQQGADERRDSYLKQAIEANPQANIAVSLTQAELQIAHSQTEQALATLTRLRNLAPRHDHVLHLLANLYRDTDDWPHLVELLPELRKRQVFDAEQITALESCAWKGLLSATDTRDADVLQNRWDQLPRRAREDEQTLLAYVTRLVELNADERAETLVRNALNRTWSSPLVRLYGVVRGDDPARQLDYGETWLKNHGRDPMLLLSLGRLCKRRSLWGKARIYLESSLGLQSLAETHLELAELLETLGEKESALEHYRRGLSISVESGLPRASNVVRAMVKRDSKPDAGPAEAPAEASSRS